MYGVFTPCMYGVYQFMLTPHTSPSSSATKGMLATALEAQKEEDEMSKVCVK